MLQVTKTLKGGGYIFAQTDSPTTSYDVENGWKNFVVLIQHWTNIDTVNTP